MSDVTRNLLTGNLVDLDVFSAGVVDYTFTDAKGVERHFPLPVDLPFPIAVAIERAYDAWYAETARLLNSSGAKAEERLGRSVETLWAAELAAFAAAVQLRSPDVTAEQLEADIGRVTLLQWIHTVIARLQMAQSGATMEAYLAKLIELASEPEAVEADPKAKKPSRSRRSSATSGAPAAGRTTTGARSAGASSGPRVAS